MLNERVKKRLPLICMHGILIMACLTVLFPLLWILRTSFAHRVIAYQIPPKWFFTPTFENYITIFKEEPFHLFFTNSLIVALASTLVCLIIGAPAAFSYSRFRTGGRIGCGNRCSSFRRSGPKPCSPRSVHRPGRSHFRAPIRSSAAFDVFQCSPHD